MCSSSDLSEKTIYDYINSAKVEVTINITHGIMSIDALLAIYEASKSKEDWVMIFNIAKEIKSCEEIEKKEKNKGKKIKGRWAKINSKRAKSIYPTKSQVKEAVAIFEKHKDQSLENICEIVQSNVRSKIYKQQPKKTKNNYSFKIKESEIYEKRFCKTFEKIKDKVLSMSEKNKSTVLKHLEEPNLLMQCAYYASFFFSKKAVDQLIDDIEMSMKTRKPDF